MTDLIQIAVLSSVAISCGLLGPFLVLSRLSMFANSLSHTILLGIALAFLVGGGAFFDLSNLLIGALLAALMTALLTGGLIRYFQLSEDASTGLVFTSLFALGITVVTLYTRDVHLGLEAVMGNADLLQLSDLRFSLSLAAINLLSVSLCYKQFLLFSFDSKKFPLFYFLVALNCVGAFRAVGVLLVLAFLVGPFLIARLFCHRLKWLLFWTPVVGIVASILGVLLSRFIYTYFDCPLSTGGLIASLIGLFYFISVKLQPCKNGSPC